MRLSSVAVLCSALALSVAPSASHAQSCSSGFIAAVPSRDAGFEHLYKYCLEVRWDLGRYEMSHMDIFLALPNCPCICSPLFVRFSSPAGASTNGAASCGLDYYGEYVCKGDPSLPSEINGPAVKFEPDPSSACAPGVSGFGTVCFYSPMPPGESNVFPQGIAIKHGQQVCYAILEGELPSCDCALPAGSTTWGALKASYR